MATTRWDPFRDLAALQDRVNRIFEDVMTRPRRGAEPDDLNVDQWSPAAEVFETAESLVIRLEVPGIEQQGLDIEIVENSLVVRGERKFEPVEGRNYQQRERAYGTFRRVFPIPMPVQQDRIQAVLKHGVLEITLLKEETGKPRRVQVEVH
jgi:HSP20 family protein